ncbi:c-type cytochrome domain-containing protein [Anatilimnocola floriformis]|uniref:c-type cytochrome domain-containing protein n=1 Tax=Anatilimnocola floriformis TaxID=2948575 RepID=UPI0020C4B7C2|nr:c-type cytochrome domain-containing protein [Anatilimnocola floriformis]
MRHFPAIVVCLLVLPAWLAGAGAARCCAQPAVDFERDIKPILSEHCWKCHGEKRAAGGLRLDQRKFAERGGGSGRKLLELAASKNELLRRVESTVEGERMPSEGPPLTQPQIDMLERWIAQGANWPEVAPPPPDWQLSDKSLFDIWLDRIAYTTTSRYLPAYIIVMTILISIIIVERAKQPRSKVSVPERTLRRRLQTWLRHLSRAWYLVALLGVVLFVAVQFSREQADELRRQNKKITTSLEMGIAKHHAPLRPQHPPRLGGAYYRGNDERSAELYNGGFYRTATFEIHLADAEGRNLAWGDPVPDQPQLHFVLERSPHSSPTLFTPEIMESSGLSAVQPEQLAKTKDIPFLHLRADLPGERWSLLYPLEPIPAEGKRTGSVYLYKGTVNDPEFKSAEPSYLIGYELSASDGLISRESQIWMASVYNVPQLIWPEQGKIPADHWFDFRPIPEIEK